MPSSPTGARSARFGRYLDTCRHPPRPEGSGAGIAANNLTDVRLQTQFSRSAPPRQCRLPPELPSDNSQQAGSATAAGPAAIKKRMIANDHRHKTSTSRAATSAPPLSSTAAATRCWSSGLDCRMTPQAATLARLPLWAATGSPPPKPGPASRCLQRPRVRLIGASRRARSGHRRRSRAGGPDAGDRRDLGSHPGAGQDPLRSRPDTERLRGSRLRSAVNSAGAVMATA